MATVKEVLKGRELRLADVSSADLARMMHEDAIEARTKYKEKYGDNACIAFAFDGNFGTANYVIDLFHERRDSTVEAEAERTLDNVRKGQFADYFANALGYEFIVEYDDKYSSCHFSKLRFIHNDEYQRKIKANQGWLAKDIADFYKDTTYFGD